MLVGFGLLCHMAVTMAVTTAVRTVLFRRDTKHPYEKAVIIMTTANQGRIQIAWQEN